MTDYKKMYTTLFNAVTDALEKMEVQNYGDAKELLISAQQKTEEIYITAQNDNRNIFSDRSLLSAVISMV